MRLVKAHRRDLPPQPVDSALLLSANCVSVAGLAAAVAVSAVALVSACSAGPPAPREMDCRGVLRRPVEPHVVTVREDGTVVPGPRCATATCIAGASGVSVWRDGELIHATVGDRKLDVPVKPGSPLMATHSMPGVAVGGGLLAVDRGATLELFGADGSTRSVPMPALAPGVVVVRLGAVDGGVLGNLSDGSRPDDQEAPVVLVPLKTPPPADAVGPVVDEHHALKGWVVAGARASFVATDGTRRALGMALPPEATLQSIGDLLLVAVARKHTLIAPGHDPVEIDEHIAFAMAGPDVLAIDPRPPGTLSEVRNGQLVPVMTLASALPAGGHVERITVAQHKGAALLIERIQLDTCVAQDRVVLLDVAKRTARVLADDDKMRMHPVWAGDRFSFVEADADLSSP